MSLTPPVLLTGQVWSVIWSFPLNSWDVLISCNHDKWESHTQRSLYFKPALPGLLQMVGVRSSCRGTTRTPVILKRNSFGSGVLCHSKGHHGICVVFCYSCFSRLHFCSSLLTCSGSSEPFLHHVFVSPTRAPLCESNNKPCFSTLT